VSKESPLGPDDVLFFVHVPKTGGISLYEVIDANFAPEEILPVPESEDMEKAFRDLSPSDLAKLRCVRGHFWFGPGDRAVHDFLLPNPVIITFLRDPVARTVAVFQFLTRNPNIWLGKRMMRPEVQSPARAQPPLEEGEIEELKAMELMDFVCHPAAQREIRNLQARQVLGTVPGNPRHGTGDPAQEQRMSDEELLSRAKKRVEEFAFVGLTERFDESVTALTRMLGWDPPQRIPWLNRSGKDPSGAYPVPDEAHSAILDRTRVDRELYEHARELFYAKLAKDPEAARPIATEGTGQGDGASPPDTAQVSVPLPSIQEETDDGRRDLFEGARQWLGNRRFSSSRPLAQNCYVLAMLPRTGSTALCSLLSETGVLGYPDEYFNPRATMQLWARLLASRNLTEYASALRRERATPNGVFGIKATFDDLRPVLEPEIMRQLLGDLKFVFLTRDDLAAQAVSAFLAEETGIWHRDQQGLPWYSVPREEHASIEFDEDRILAILDHFVRMGQAWERFFARSSVAPLHVTYERFCADPQGVVRDVAEYLGVKWKGDVSMSMAVTSKLGDERSQGWTERIRAAWGGPSEGGAHRIAETRE
jgi:trehalose 2-sulfotransferase